MQEYMKESYKSYLGLIKNKKVKGSGEDPRLKLYSEPVQKNIGKYKLVWIQEFLPSGTKIVVYDI